MDAGKEQKAEEIRFKYLLSEKELNLTVISGGSVNDSMLDFDWYASDITGNVVTIQLIFKNPSYISSEMGLPEKLQVQFLRQSLKCFRSKK